MFVGNFRTISPKFGFQTQPAAGKSKQPEAATPLSTLPKPEESMTQPLFQLSTELSQTGKITWKIARNQPFLVTLANGQQQTIYSDVATAVDPLHVRPDGTGQHYFFTVWMNPEIGTALMFKGEQQENKDGHCVSVESLGREKFQQLIKLIESHSESAPPKAAQG